MTIKNLLKRIANNNEADDKVLIITPIDKHSVYFTAYNHIEYLRTEYQVVNNLNTEIIIPMDTIIPMFVGIKKLKINTKQVGIKTLSVTMEDNATVDIRAVASCSPLKFNVTDFEKGLKCYDDNSLLQLMAKARPFVKGVAGTGTNRVFLDVKAKKIVSTDGIVLSMLEAGKSLSFLSENVLIENIAFRSMDRLKFQDIRIGFTNSSLKMSAVFKGDIIQYAVATPATQTYPKYEMLVPQDHKFMIRLKSDRLLELMKLMIASKATSIIFDTKLGVIRDAEGKVQSKSIKLVDEHTCKSFGFSLDKLNTIIKAHKKVATPILRGSSHEDLFIIDFGKAQFLLSPLRISS